MTTSSQVLNLNQSPDELDHIYGDLDYYWYLRSDVFVEAFIKPLARQVNVAGGQCLDLGCGEGQLAPWIEIPYLGIDGSSVAISRACQRNLGHAKFCVARFESFVPEQSYRSVVFGNILSVLTMPSWRVPLMKRYALQADARYVFVYDLEELDTSEIDKQFTTLWEHHASVEIEGPAIVETKKHRKILQYQCHP